MTESYDAGNAGIVQFWEEAVNQGNLDGEEYVLEWLARIGTTGTCPRCIALDGKTRHITTGLFVSDIVASGSFKGQIIRIKRPVVHPRCRCATRIVLAAIP
jgi:hypothetical protein